LIFKFFQLADMLLLKTIPEVNWKGQGCTLKPKAKVLMAAPPKKKVKTHSVEVEEVEDEDKCKCLVSHRRCLPKKKKVNVAMVPALHYSKHHQGIKKNPIHLFYEVVPTGDDGKLGDNGDIHYHCLHGVHKVCTIKKTMKSNLTVLVNNLKSVTPMYNLYRILKDHDEPLMPNEIALASGKKVLDGRAEAEHLKILEMSTENIKKAFEDQKAHAAGPWDQEKIERLLTEWIVACDQPFSEVKQPEFVELLNYAHHGTSPLKIPQHNLVKRQVMKLGEEMVEEVHEMFLVE
ncbi:hypothetical protein L208DRAFT_1294576, partial [Tricholoma matsutake]